MDDKNILFKKFCHFQGHQRHHIEVICFEKECIAQKRFACAKCICEFHGGHVKKCVFLRDILDQEIQVEGWINKQIDSKIENIQIQLCTQRKSIEKDIILLQRSLIQNIEILRQMLKTNYLNNRQISDQFLSQIRNLFKKVYNLEPIFELYQQYFKKQINQETFSARLKSYISNESRHQQIKELILTLKKKDRQCPEISRSSFNDASSKIIQESSQISQALKTDEWFFIAPKIGAFNTHIKTIENGKVFELTNLDTQQYLYGSQVFKQNQEHSWSFKFENIPNNAFNNIYIGITSDSKKDETTATTQSGNSLFIDIINSVMAGQGLELQPNKKQISEIIKKKIQSKQSITICFTLNFSEKSFSVFDYDKESLYIYNQDKYKQRVNNPQNFGNIGAQLFFNKNPKLRPFIMSFQATAKVTLINM